MPNKTVHVKNEKETITYCITVCAIIILNIISINTSIAVSISPYPYQHHIHVHILIPNLMTGRQTFGLQGSAFGGFITTCKEPFDFVIWQSSYHHIMYDDHHFIIIVKLYHYSPSLPVSLTCLPHIFYFKDGFQPSQALTSKANKITVCFSTLLLVSNHPAGEQPSG